MRSAKVSKSNTKQFVIEEDKQTDRQCTRSKTNQMCSFTCVCCVRGCDACMRVFSA